MEFTVFRELLTSFHKRNPVFPEHQFPVCVHLSIFPYLRLGNDGVKSPGRRQAWVVLIAERRKEMYSLESQSLQIPSH